MSGRLRRDWAWVWIHTGMPRVGSDHFRRRLFPPAMAATLSPPAEGGTPGPLRAPRGDPSAKPACQPRRAVSSDTRSGNSEERQDERVTPTAGNHGRCKPIEISGAARRPKTSDFVQLFPLDGRQDCQLQAGNWGGIRMARNVLAACWKIASPRVFGFPTPYVYPLLTQAFAAGRVSTVSLLYNRPETRKAAEFSGFLYSQIGAGEGIRTLDPNLGDTVAHREPSW